MIALALALWALATADAAFCGFRAAAGRSLLLDKRGHFGRAMLRGALVGQLAVLVVLVAFLVLRQTRGAAVIDPPLATAAKCLLIVFIPYATALFLALAIRVNPSVDLRSISSVTIFGPFTLLRPLVVVGAGAYAIRSAQVPVAIVLVTIACVASLALGPILGRAYVSRR